jgi:hypothetical protein
MKNYKNIITLNKNKRGCYILDTIKGCSVCLKEKPNGCYDNCYAKGIATRYNFNFSNVIKRDFDNDKKQLCLNFFKNTDHEDRIIKEIQNIDMPFVRIGEMGDPSEDWQHTINVCKVISKAKKPIVIVTKHWKPIPFNLLSEIKKLNICVNTSISALDTSKEIDHRLKQYNILKDYCNSVLRVVTCDFNKYNIIGCLMAEEQERLLGNDKVIDTIFRVNKNNNLVKDEIINVKKVTFMGSKSLVSIYNNKTYFGFCNGCLEMCGINL